MSMASSQSVLLFLISLVVLVLKCHTIEIVNHCPNGWLSVPEAAAASEPMPDCILLLSNFSGTYRQAEEHCFGQNNSRLAVLRDAAFSRLLGAAAAKTSVTAKSATNNKTPICYWIGASIISGSVAWLNNSYLDGSRSPLPIASDDVTKAKDSDFACIELQSNGQLAVRFRQQTENHSVACALQSLEPPVLQPIHDVATACPAGSVWQFGGICYATLPMTQSTIISEVCRDWSKPIGTGLAAPNDWLGYNAVASIVDRLNETVIIGLSAATNGNAWSWDGRPDVIVRMTAWADGQPKLTSSNRCSAISPVTGLYSAAPCKLDKTAPGSFYILCQTPVTSAGAQSSSGKGAAKLYLVAEGTRNCRTGFFWHEQACYHVAADVDKAVSNVSEWCATKYNASALWVTRPGQLAFASLLATASKTANLTGVYYALTWPVPFAAGWEKFPTRLPSPNSTCLGFAAGTGALTTDVLCDKLRPACRYDLNLPAVMDSKLQSGGSGASFSESCPPGWKPTDNGGRCLAVSSNKAISWFEADAVCGALHKNASLASLHASSEVPDVTGLLVGTVSEAWIGLKTRRSANGLIYPIWSDGTPFDYYATSTSVDTFQQSQVQCAYVSKLKDGNITWTLTTKCTAKLPALCQTLAAATATLTTKTIVKLNTTTATVLPNATATLAPTASTIKPKVLSFADACTEGVSNRSLSADGTRCYAYTVLSNQSTSWLDASKSCKALKGELVSIQTESENEYVYKYLSSMKISSLVWIGLNEGLGQLPDQLTVWSDGQIVQWVNFPSDGSEEAVSESSGKCVAMMASLGKSNPTVLSPKKWYVQDCRRTLPAVCKILHSSNEIAPMSAQSTLKPSVKPLNTSCPNGWTAYDNSAACYRLLRGPFTFEKARMECQSLGGDLASYQTSGQHEFLTSILASLGRRAGLAWIGLLWVTSGHAADHFYRWLDDSKVEFLDWPFGRKISFPVKSCVALRYHPLLAKSGTQVKSQCSLPLPALCRIKASILPSAIRPTESKCPIEGYQEFNGSCYKYGEEAASFDSATKQCLSDGAKLLWLESAFEVHFLRSMASAIKKPPPFEVWLSLESQTDAVTSLNWTANDRPLRFDYLLQHSRHYELKSLSGCYSFQLYNHPTPAAIGLRKIPLGFAFPCSTKKNFFCKSSALGAAPPVPAIESACFEAPGTGGSPYMGTLSRSVSGRECVRWDLVTVLYENEDAKHFRNKSDTQAAIDLSPANLRSLENINDDNDAKETLGESANFCRQLVSRDAGNADLGPPVCFVRLPSATGDWKLGLELCPIPICGHVAFAPRRSETSVGALAAIVMVCACAVAVVSVLGFCMWKRGRWAAGYRPQLNLDTAGREVGAGGTSFHNPIYMPANC